MTPTACGSRAAGTLRAFLRARSPPDVEDASALVLFFPNLLSAALLYCTRMITNRCHPCYTVHLPAGTGPAPASTQFIVPRQNSTGAIIIVNN